MTLPARRVPPLKAVATYQRPMRGWYNRNGFYSAYMFREATCIAVGYFALLVLCALERLSAGEAAFTHFMSTMGSTWWVAFHGIVLAAVVYHAWTWFAVMPKTMPFIYVGGKSLPDRNIIAAGAASGILGALAILIALKVTAP